MPLDFYDLELRNPKRQTNFSSIAKHLLDKTPGANIERLKLEETLMEQKGNDMADELKMYQSLVSNRIRFYSHRVSIANWVNWRSSRIWE